MTKIWNTVIGSGLLLIAVATVFLRRGATTTSIATQLILFIIIGAILLGLGGVMRYIQRGDTDAPDIDVPPYGIGILGVAACLAGPLLEHRGDRRMVVLRKASRDGARGC